MLASRIIGLYEHREQKPNNQVHLIAYSSACCLCTETYKQMPRQPYPTQKPTWPLRPGCGNLRRRKKNVVYSNASPVRPPARYPGHPVSLKCHAKVQCKTNKEKKRLASQICIPRCSDLFPKLHPANVSRKRKQEYVERVPHVRGHKRKNMVANGTVVV